MKLKQILDIFILLLFLTSYIGCTILKKIPPTNDLNISGKWMVMSYGAISHPWGWMHGSFRIEFNNDTTGSYFHFRDTINKCSFNYSYSSKNNKLILKNNGINPKCSILEGYKNFECKMGKIKVRKSKFFSLELFTQDSQKFVLVRPTTHGRFWKE